MRFEYLKDFFICRMDLYLILDTDIGSSNESHILYIIWGYCYYQFYVRCSSTPIQQEKNSEPQPVKKRKPRWKRRNNKRDLFSRILYYIAKLDLPGNKQKIKERRNQFQKRFFSQRRTNEEKKKNPCGKKFSDDDDKIFCYEVFIDEHGDKSLFQPPTRRPYARNNNALNPSNVQSDGRIADTIYGESRQQNIFLPQRELRQEINRISTFENFPQNCPVNGHSLAKSGFYYTGISDRVKCISCGTEVDSWQPQDNPEDPKWHRQECPFRRATPSSFGRENANSALQRSNQQQQEQVLEQRDPVSGALIRTVRYPADLPARIRSTGGTFDIGPNNTVNVHSGQGHQRDLIARPGNEAAPPRTAPAPRPFRLARVDFPNQQRLLGNLFLNREIDRLASFCRWDMARPNVAPAALARSGFFYLGDLDRTQCFSCGGVLRNWMVEDDPMQEHRSHFPECQMMLGTENRNVPVPEQEESQAQNLINYPCDYPASGHMRNQNSRVDTFDRRWAATHVRATPAQIAEAGFFFLGERDRVKCWYCNGGLQNWDYDDIPWVEHSKWFPNCQYLLQQKGQRFVYRHLSINPNLARPVIAKQEGSPLGGMAIERRGYDIPPTVRPPTPPIEVIDPQEEERKKQEKVERVLENSEAVKMVLAMGYERNIVKQVLEAKVHSGDVENEENIYDGVTSLLDDVQAKEKEIQEQEEEEAGASGSDPVNFSRYTRFQPSFPSGLATGSSIGASGSGIAMLSEDFEEDEKMDIYTTVKPNEGKEVATHPKSLLASMPEDPKSIEAMISKIEDERLCKVCLSEPAVMVFIPCSHMCCCLECTKALRNCPICRSRIEKAIKTYSK